MAFGDSAQLCAVHRYALGRVFLPGVDHVPASIEPDDIYDCRYAHSHCVSHGQSYEEGRNPTIKQGTPGAEYDDLDGPDDEDGQSGYPY